MRNFVILCALAFSLPAAAAPKSDALCAIYVDREHIGGGTEDDQMGTCVNDAFELVIVNPPAPWDVIERIVVSDNTPSDPCAENAEKERVAKAALLEKAKALKLAGRCDRIWSW